MPGGTGSWPSGPTGEPGRVRRGRDRSTLGDAAGDEGKGSRVRLRATARPSRTMSPASWRPRPRSPHGGQSIVEFALVVPILVVLFVGIADFGRIFNAGVIVEAAARDAAEHAAQRYLADPPGDRSLTAAERLSVPPPVADPAYYAALRDDAARVACAETRQLPNNDFAGGTCPTWPAVAVCIHDGADPSCGATPVGFAAPPAGCTELNAPWPDPAPGNGERWVEVRVCYRFTALLSLPLFSLGDFHVQRTRSFTIPCYFATGFGGCP